VLANVVAVWSQSGGLRAISDPVTGPLSCGDGGAPRGIRTPNRQIRSQPSPIPIRPPDPFVYPLVLVNGHVAGPSRASVPIRHVWLGRNVVAVSGQRRQTRSLATRRLRAVFEPEHQTQVLVLSTWRNETQPPASYEANQAHSPGTWFLAGHRPRAVAVGLTLAEEAGFRPRPLDGRLQLLRCEFACSGVPWDHDG
jgi:hypothetical protein